MNSKNEQKKKLNNITSLSARIVNGCSIKLWSTMKSYIENKTMIYYLTNGRLKKMWHMKSIPPHVGWFFFCICIHLWILEWTGELYVIFYFENVGKLVWAFQIIAKLYKRQPQITPYLCQFSLSKVFSPKAPDDGKKYMIIFYTLIWTDFEF